ncbi:MAG: hypothetical protein GWP91_04280 [Rhodobacterales bacterium]|nr:hypothetical protein [Rhodobacterales bacterium]
MRRLVAFIGLIALTGCNQYELFRPTGYQQDSFSNKADVLFVIDNSESMTPYATSLAVNFGDFVGELAELEDTTVRESLSDAVGNYIDYGKNRSAYLNYQFGITTTDVDAQQGNLVGSNKNKVLERGEDRLDMKFIENLLCEATCFPTGSISGGGGGSCNVPPTEVTTGYLDCLCGEGNWENNCGTSTEEGLEATFLAMCRSVPNPPEACFNDIAVGDDEWQSLLTRVDTDSNTGFMRQRSTFLPILVTDEGDSSRRLAQGNQIPDDYAELFRMFGANMAWVVIGAPANPSLDLVCPGTATEWQTIRYEYFVHTTNGLKINIQDPNSCEPIDFGTALQEIGELLSSLLTAFPLTSVPKVDTIVVFVDGKEIERAESLGTDDFGLEVYRSGWAYVPETNAIQFHGESIPQNDAEVKVYFEPLDGMPRELPF